MLFTRIIMIFIIIYYFYQTPEYNPCYYRDINYESLLQKYSFQDLIHRNADKDEIKACTSWQFNTTEFGDTITSEVIIGSE